MTNINEFDCQGGSPNQYFFEFRILTILDNANAVILIGYEIDQGSILHVLYFMKQEIFLYIYIH